MLRSDFYWMKASRARDLYKCSRVVGRCWDAVLVRRRSMHRLSELHCYPAPLAETCRNWGYWRRCCYIPCDRRPIHLLRTKQSPASFFTSFIGVVGLTIDVIYIFTFFLNFFHVFYVEKTLSNAKYKYVKIQRKIFLEGDLAMLFIDFGLLRSLYCKISYLLAEEHWSHTNLEIWH